MSDDYSQPVPEAAGNALLPEGSDGDPLLAALISIVRRLSAASEGEPTSISISIVVGGQFWTGQLVSAKAWSTYQGDRLRNFSNNPEVGSAFALFFDGFNEAQDAVPLDSPIVFLHLMNAHPVVMGVNVAGEGVALRLRLTDVNGWALGSPSFT